MDKPVTNDPVSRWTRPLTNSERRVWQACRFRWALQYGLRLSLPERPRPLRVGTLWHAAMERLNRGELLGDILAWLDTIGAQPQQPCDGGGFVFDPHADHDARADAAHVASMLSRYALHWFDGRGWEPVAVEVKARDVMERGDDVDGYAGKIDMIAKLDGQYWLVEHKTSSQPLSGWLDKNAYDQQAVGYAWLAERALNLKVVGVVYDLAYSGRYDRAVRRRKDGSPYKVADGTLPSCLLSDFDAACTGHAPEAWWGSVREGLRRREADGYWFREEVVRFGEDEVDRFGEELAHLRVAVTCNVATLGIIEHIALQGEELTTLPWHEQAAGVVEIINHPAMAEFARTPGACWAYNRPCPYMELCQTRSLEAAERFTVRSAVHAELEDEEAANDGARQPT